MRSFYLPLALLLSGCSLIVPGEDDFTYCDAEPCGARADAGQPGDGGMDAGPGMDAGAGMDAGDIDGGAVSDAAGSDGGVPPIANNRVAAGAEHSCFLRSGTVWCTGLAPATGLTFAGVSRPRQVGGILPNDIIDIAAGHDFTCALSGSGRLFCWGLNTEGQLGTGTADRQDAPVRAAADYSDFDAVVAAFATVCARRRNGEVLCWGEGRDGQLGDGNFASSLSPVVSGVSSPTRLAGGDSHFCAVMPGGTVECWGLNRSGVLGSGGVGARSAAPVEVPLVRNATDVAAGLSHSCALTGGTVLCWGAGDRGQIGNGRQDFENGPLPPAALPPGLTLLFAGNNQACAGMGLNLWCWGENIWGTIGVPSEPGAALTPAALSPFPASLDGMAGRNRHVCARQTDQEAYCWGVGYGGELGDGTNGEASSPSLVLF